MNKQIMEAVGFGEEVKAVEASKCPFCHTEINMNDFKDKLSLKEFKISGLCQKCQDKTFGK
jgi:hypothetical protein